MSNQSVSDKIPKLQKSSVKVVLKLSLSSVLNFKYKNKACNAVITMF